MSETTGKIKQWQLILAPASACIPTMFIILLTFASYVATGVYGVSTVLAGYIITGTRVFDAITDPLIGLWCDRFESKWGRARPLSIIGWAIMSVSVFAMFKLGLGAGLGLGALLLLGLFALGWRGGRGGAAGLGGSAAAAAGGQRQRHGRSQNKCKHFLLHNHLLL